MTAQSGKTPEIHFDVISLKENLSGDERGILEIQPAGHRIVAVNVPMFRLIGFAFGRQRSDLIDGLPEWARQQHWDLQATIADDSVPAFQSLDFAHQSALLQDILRDRCHLQAHTGRKIVPVYALVVAKSGLKMHPSPPSGPEGHPDGWDITQTNGHLHGRDVPMEALLYMLSKINLDRQVVDQTGLKARYDFDLTWTPDELSNLTEPASGDTKPPSLFTAMQEQLGLRLEATKAEVDAVLIDHIDRPTPN
jgi:uncharacterized protein (TIGR03435 family)